jgi:hypothetical protein
MRKLFGVIWLVTILCLPALAQQHLNTGVAKWEAKFEFDNELYPSCVLALTGPRDKSELPSDYIGDPAGLAEVWIISSTPNARVHIEINLEGWASLSQLDATLAEAGKRYRLAPVINYDFTRLAGTNQSYPAVIKYAVRVNGIDLGWEFLQIRIRSVNDVPFYSESSLNGGPQDLSAIFAGFVNESHPALQQILQDGLQRKVVNQFSGYQVDAAGVSMQVFAIWNVLQKRRVRYSDATTPSASSLSGKVYSQAVRFIDESIDYQQANCVDGSVLFASVLYKIGIRPILVLKPGHMFVGYWLDEKQTQYEFLETTMIGAGRQPGSLKESFAQFSAAVLYASEVFNQEVQPAINQEKAGYFMIDIAECRKAGIYAIPRPGR